MLGIIARCHVSRAWLRHGKNFASIRGSNSSFASQEYEVKIPVHRGFGMTTGALLRARPMRITRQPQSGLQSLGGGDERDSYLYVPSQYDARQPAPFVLLLHGAGGHAHHGMDILRHLADEKGLILVAPASAGVTWDVIIERRFGTDVVIVDRALQETFSRCAINAARMAIAGFSDGASYALSLGLANGDLFSHMIAFSPGFVAPAVPRGRPKVFVSHGRQDQVLPIAHCSRRIIPRLEQTGYDVIYHEFNGGHMIPPHIAREAVDWFIGR